MQATLGTHPQGPNPGNDTAGMPKPGNEFETSMSFLRFYKRMQDVLGL